jgi:type II restriction/modification system DNA methylase subunit YeeA
MLTYAFDLLYAIYEEEGYEPAEIPEKILTHNLYGIEIDERAGELAAFALTMKARAKQRRFFNKGVKPNICVLENVHFDEGELKSYMGFVGRDLLTAPLQTTLRQFEEADNFGSLIRPDVTDVDGMLRTLEAKDVSDQLFLSDTHQKVLQALRQADYLSPKYHVVIANPPYMGGGGMNPRLNAWVKQEYPDSKADLMTCFMERAPQLVFQDGFWGMINLPSWMFLSSFEKLRQKILRRQTIVSLVHPGRGIFGSDFGSVAFVMNNRDASEGSSATYRKLYEKFVQVRTPEETESLFLGSDYGKHILNQNEFLKIPGAPLAYWVSNKFRRIFENPPLSDHFQTRLGLSTANNDRFLRNWQEVSLNSIGFDFGSRDAAQKSQLKWFPYEKGGAFRKWFGNHDFLVNWQNDGEEIRDFGKKAGRIRSHNYNLDFIFKEGVTWSDVTSGTNAFRFMPEGFLFDGRGSSGFVHQRMLLDRIFGFLNSKISTYAISAINPTVAINVGEIAKLPFPDLDPESGIQVDEAVNALTSTHKANWDSHETSWDFTGLPLLKPDYRQPTLKATYQKLRAHWREMTLEMQRLEEENNRIFIEAYGLQDELTPEVPLNEITLTCNPHYRYGKDKNEEELEALLLADTMREFISYAVGCMFGRYSLDEPGLILANQGETLEDYLRRIPEPTFMPDDDNVIPVLGEEWFHDDIVGRFHTFLRTTFGEEHFEENLRFIENALGKNGKPRPLRTFFLRDFYTDHVKRYKKRPIYWMFSSPKGSFNALISMHRYRPDTVSVVLNGYLRELKTKIEAQIIESARIVESDAATARETSRAAKEGLKLGEILAELITWEREVLYPLATKRIEIDLDDGVKVNYPKFGTALKRVPGLSAG